MMKIISIIFCLWLFTFNHASASGFEVLVPSKNDNEHTFLFVITEETDGIPDIMDVFEKDPFGRSKKYKNTQVSCNYKINMVNFGDNKVALKSPNIVIGFKIQNQKNEVSIIQGNIVLSAGHILIMRDPKNIIEAGEFLMIDFVSVQPYEFASNDEAQNFVNSGGCKIFDAKAAELHGAFGEIMFSDRNDWETFENSIALGRSNN